MNSTSTKSYSIKRKRDDDLELIEKKQKYSDSSLDNNILSKIKSTYGLSVLPTELLEIIFQNLDIEQVFILGLQSQYLWNVARRYLLSHYASLSGT